MLKRKEQLKSIEKETAGLGAESGSKSGKVISIEQAKKAQEQEARGIGHEAKDFAEQKRLEQEAAVLAAVETKVEQARKLLAEKTTETESLKPAKSTLGKGGDKMRAGFLKLRGVKDTEEMTELISWLEENAQAEHDPSKSYEFHRKDLKALKRLTGRESDPVEVIDKLKRAGLSIDSGQAKHDIANLKAIMEIPNVEERIDALRALDAEFEAINIGKKEQIQEWADLMKDEAVTKALTPKIQERVFELSAIIGERVDPYNLREYLDIAQNPETCRLVRLLGGEDGVWENINKERESDYFTKNYDTAYKLKALQERGLISPLLTLVESGINPYEFSGIMLAHPIKRQLARINFDQEEESRAQFRKNYSKEKIKKLETLLDGYDVRPILKKEVLTDYVADVSAITGQKFNISELARLRRPPIPHENFLLPLPLLYVMKEFTGQADFTEAAELLQKEKALGQIVYEKGFHDLARHLKQNLPNASEFFNNNIAALVALYQEKPVREKIMTEEGSGIMEFFAEAKPGKANIFQPKMLDFLSVPHALNTLENLREFYGYYVDTSAPDDPWAFAEDYIMLMNIIVGEESRQAFERAVDYLWSKPELKKIVLALTENMEPEKTELITSIPVLETLNEHKQAINPDVLAEYSAFYSDPRVIDFLEQNPDKFLDVYSLHKEGVLDKKNLYPLYIDHIEEIITAPEGKRAMYVEICQKIDLSPSQEIQRIKSELVTELLRTENPRSAYKSIEAIFVKNNLPLVGKVYKVFEILHPKDELNKTLASHVYSSPYLRKSKTRRRYYTIYKDLLKTHIQSGNRSLRDYLQILQSGEGVLENVEEKGFDGLTAKEKSELRHFLLKIQILFESSQLGRQTAPEGLYLEQDMLNAYQELRQHLNVKEGQKITERITEMFLKPLGYKNIDEVLADMKQSKQRAHQRGLKLAKEARQDFLTLKKGDLLKGVKIRYIASILQNGNAAKEYLGAGAGSDSTPFDTDVSMVLERESRQGFEKIIGYSLAKDFGNLIFAVKDRNQYQLTDPENVKDYNPEKLELFNSGTERHYGIRTGFPTTEIDFMIAKKALVENKRELQKIYFEIAQNGYYIPVTDTSGKIIFTPKQYQEIRKIFNGLERVDGEKLEFTATIEKDIHYQDVQAIIKKMPENREQTEQRSNQIKQIILEVLSENEVEIKEEHDTGITGAELLDAGSTARGTNAIGEFSDFDFTLRVDEKDAQKIPKIAQELKSRLQPKEDGSRRAPRAAVPQIIRFFDCKGLGEEPVDIDIGVVGKSDLVYFASYEAVEERLTWIKNNISEGAYEQAVANIILAKKILKAGKAYKTVKHGGMGGIGVENWILANRGNMSEAFNSFLKAAYRNGKPLPLEEFQAKYPILNPGTNLQKVLHDNYTEYLTQDGYQAMVETIENYLGGAEAVEIAA